MTSREEVSARATSYVEDSIAVAKTS